jgi:hypothetical protein
MSTKKVEVKVKVYCCQCRHYRRYGKSYDPREHAIEKIHRCYRGGRRINYVTGVNVPFYDDCTTHENNKWGNCKFWEPKWIIRLLLWRTQ